MGNQDSKQPTQVILFNGPPSTGKDYAVNILREKRLAPSFTFKKYVEDILRSIYGVPEHVWRGWTSTQEGKATPRKELLGMTPRECLIELSEEIIKPWWGQDWIARRTVEGISTLIGHNHTSVISCSDLGFQEEFDACLEQWGKEDVHLVLLHREGCTFKGDSRYYIEDYPEDWYNIHMINNKGDDSFEESILRLYDYIVKSPKQ